MTSQMLGDADLRVQRGAAIQLYGPFPSYREDGEILCKRMSPFSFLNQNTAWHIQALGKYLENSVRRLKQRLVVGDFN